MNPFHSSLLTALAPKGLTSQHMDLLLEDGYETPSQVTRLTVSELKTILGIKGGLASDILSVAEAAKSSDFETTKTNEDAVIRTLLENLVGSADIRTSAVTELQKRGIHFVVLNEGRALAWEETLRFLASPDRRVAEGHGLWNDMALVDVGSFLPDLTPLRSPYSEEALVECRDIRTDIPWGILPRDHLGLAVWAVQERMDGGLPQRTVFEDFQTQGQLFQRALKLSAVKGLATDQLRLMALHRAAKPTPTQQAQPKAPGLRGMTPRKALYDLLSGLFSADELRRVCVNSLGLTNNDLPGASVSLATLVDEVISVLDRVNAIDHDFFEILLLERPRCKRDIDQVRVFFP